MGGGPGGDHREDTVAGGYAWVLTANGQIFLVNIDPVQRSIKAVVHEDQKVLFDPDPASVATYADQRVRLQERSHDGGPGVLEPPPFPNRPRDRNFLSYSASLDPTLGLVRVDIPPIAVTGPYIEPLWTQGTEDNATARRRQAQTDVRLFPRSRRRRGPGLGRRLAGDDRQPALLRRAPRKRPPGRLADVSASSACQAGDIVTLNGCTTDTQCPLGMTCQRDPTLDLVSGGFTVTGLCVSANLQRTIGASARRTSARCAGTRSTEASNSELTLAPHLDELVRSSLTPVPPHRRGRHDRHRPARVARAERPVWAARPARPGRRGAAGAAGRVAREGAAAEWAARAAPRDGRRQGRPDQRLRRSDRRQHEQFQVRRSRRAAALPGSLHEAAGLPRRARLPPKRASGTLTARPNACSAKDGMCRTGPGVQTNTTTAVPGRRDAATSTVSASATAIAPMARRWSGTTSVSRS